MVTSLEEKQEESVAWNNGSNCGDTALEEYNKEQRICRHMWSGRTLRIKERKTNEP